MQSLDRRTPKDSHFNDGKLHKSERALLFVLIALFIVLFFIRIKNAPPPPTVNSQNSLQVDITAHGMCLAEPDFALGSGSSCAVLVNKDASSNQFSEYSPFYKCLLIKKQAINLDITPETNNKEFQCLDKNPFINDTLNYIRLQNKIKDYKQSLLIIEENNIKYRNNFNPNKSHENNPEHHNTSAKIKLNQEHEYDIIKESIETHEKKIKLISKRLEKEYKKSYNLVDSQSKIGFIGAISGILFCVFAHIASTKFIKSFSTCHYYKIITCRTYPQHRQNDFRNTKQIINNLIIQSICKLFFSTEIPSKLNLSTKEVFTGKQIYITGFICIVFLVSIIFESRIYIIDVHSLILLERICYCFLTTIFGYFSGKMLIFGLSLSCISSRAWSFNIDLNHADKIGGLKPITEYLTFASLTFSIPISFLTITSVSSFLFGISAKDPESVSSFTSSLIFFLLLISAISIPSIIIPILYLQSRISTKVNAEKLKLRDAYIIEINKAPAPIINYEDYPVVKLMQQLEEFRTWPISQTYINMAVGLATAVLTVLLTMFLQTILSSSG